MFSADGERQMLPRQTNSSLYVMKIGSFYG